MNIRFLSLLFFVVAPLTELYVFIEVGAEIGAFSAIVLSVFTAVLGGLLVRLQGLTVLFNMQKTLAVGEAPGLEVVEAVTLLIAGFSLLLPGFITDSLGFLLLITPLRQFFVRKLFKPMSPSAAKSSFHSENNDKEHPRVIEGEYHREDEEKE